MVRRPPVVTGLSPSPAQVGPGPPAGPDGRPSDGSPPGDRGSGGLRPWLADPDHRVPLGLGLVTLLVLQLVRGRYPVEWDGAQLVMALDRFDVSDGTPHPPGYWLYIAAGRLVRALTWIDGTAALTLVSSAAAAATVGLSASLGRAIGGRLVGWLGAGLVLTSPFLLFYGASVATYTLDALACVALLTLAWHARPGGAQGLVAAGVLGLAAGFRQTSLLLFAPLVVVAMARSARDLRTWLGGAAVGAGAVASWLVPMLIEQPGGLRAWRQASDALLEGSVGQTAFFAGTAEVVTRNMSQGATYATVAFLPAALVAVVAGMLVVCGGHVGAVPPGEGRPSWVSRAALPALAAGPALVFLVAIHFGKAGYLLAALPAGILLLVVPVAGLGHAARRGVAVAGLVVCTVSAGRFLLAPAIVPESLVDATPLFLTSSVNGAPFSFTAAAVAESDRRTEHQLALADAFDPASDVLVWGWLNGGERYRHATLTLPQFTTSFVRDSRHVHTARGARWRTDPDTTLEVPPGGRAVFVLTHVPPDLEVLLAAGSAEAVPLESGITAWVVGPGVTLLGVQVVEGDTSV